VSRINPSDIPDMPSGEEPAKPVGPQVNPSEILSQESVGKLTKAVTDILSKAHDHLISIGMAHELAASYVISALMNANGVLGALFIAEILNTTGNPTPSHEEHLRLRKHVTLEIANTFNKLVQGKVGSSALIIVDVNDEKDPCGDLQKPKTQDPPKDDPKKSSKDDWAI